MRTTKAKHDSDDSDHLTPGYVGVGEWANIWVMLTKKFYIYVSFMNTIHVMMANV